MPSDQHPVRDATRVVLRPLATPIPLAFLALALASLAFSAVELGWIPRTESKEAALTAVVLSAPLQLFSAVLGFQARDPVAGTGVALQGGTWAFIGLTTLLSRPGATPPGLGVVLVGAGACLLVPAAAGLATLVPALVLALTGTRFAVSGIYYLTASPGWKAAAGVAGLVVATAAVYAALALELEGSHGRAVLPVGRRGGAAAAVVGERALDGGELAREPGVRPRL